MNYWLVKSEPETYSWEDFVNLKRDHWDGVRNYQARNNMKEMKEGEQVLFYHSGKEKAVVGLARVVKEFYPDPTASEEDKDRWVVVDLIPEYKLNKKVTLKTIKDTPELNDIALIRNSRLSVMPLTREAFELILGMSQ